MSVSTHSLRDWLVSVVVVNWVHLHRWGEGARQTICVFVPTRLSEHISWQHSMLWQAPVEAGLLCPLHGPAHGLSPRPPPPPTISFPLSAHRCGSMDSSM